MTTINNMPAHAMEKFCVVARLVDGEWWYWGAFDDAEKASEIAEMLTDGWVFKTR